jgi:7-cyano-7-deazaguanine synthase
VELDAARRVSARAGVIRHEVIQIDLRSFGGSALTDDIAVPKDRATEEIGHGVPITYVPARNTIFLSLALGYAEVHAIRDIYIGVNAVDFSGYPDCRPAFIEAFERLANVATKLGSEGSTIRIHTPLIELTKAQIIRRGIDLGADYACTLSCYDPSLEGRTCGHCDACVLRAAGFREAGLPDPAQ